ncbi:MAG: hypothetical protein AAF654_02790 [Myxococcota bacterium]
MSVRAEAGVVASALVVGAVFASSSQALLLIVPLVLCALPGRPARAGAGFLVGAILGLTPLYGLPHVAVATAVLIRGRHRWEVLGAVLLAAGPFALVAAALAHTGWLAEAARALAMGSSGVLGVLTCAWVINAMPFRTKAAGVIAACVAIGIAVPLPAPQWPAYIELRPSDDATPENLRAMLRRAAAGDVTAGHGAVGLWVDAFDADLTTVRANCPELGWLPSWGDTPYAELGAKACALANELPERALEADAGIRFRSELLAETGRIDRTAPTWLMQVTGRAPATYDSREQFNRELNFERPRPPRVRGFASQGAGRMAVSYAEDLQSFALTTATKTGGIGFYIEVPVPKELVRELVLEGVSRRGLAVEVVLDDVWWMWGCFVSGEKAVSMPGGICTGRPGQARWVFDEPKRISTLRLRGEFALKSLAARH